MISRPQVVHDAGAVKDTRIDALTLLLYEDEIPPDRKSEVHAHESPDRSLSLAMNANDIRRGRYYVSVKCSAVDAGGTKIVFCPRLIIFRSDSPTIVGTVVEFFLKKI